MQKKLLMFMVGMIIDRLDSGTMRALADKLLDMIEDVVTKSENDIDDQIVLPLCALIRSSFDIPDND